MDKYLFKVVIFFKQKRKECLIISFLFDPSTRVLSQQAFTNFVVDEDCGREWYGREPPGGLQWVHPQALVHPGGVGEEGGETGLEDQAEVEEVILHSLLEHGVLPRLTDDEVCPLDNNNGDKEGRVTGVLQDLPVGVGPLLPVGVLQVVHGMGVPRSPQTKQS